MAHIHLIDKRFRIYRVTDTRPYRHICSPDRAMHIAGYGRGAQPRHRPSIWL
jgi:hypothetical protein